MERFCVHLTLCTDYFLFYNNITLLGRDNLGNIIGKFKLDTLSRLYFCKYISVEEPNTVDLSILISLLMSSILSSNLYLALFISCFFFFLGFFFFFRILDITLFFVFKITGLICWVGVEFCGLPKFLPLIFQFLEGLEWTALLG